MDITFGSRLREIMKKEKVTQTKMAKLKNIAIKNVNETIKRFDKNQGNISTFFDYLETLGYDIEFNLIRKEYKEGE